MIFRSTDRLVIRNSGIATRQAPLLAASGGWWDSLTSAEGAWEGALAASQAASYVDLTGNGNDLTARTGTVNWTTGLGWSGFAADTSVLYTGIDAPGEDKAMMIQFDSISANGSRTPMGCSAPLEGNTAFAIQSDASSAWGTNKRAYETAGAAGTRTGVVTSGTMALCGGQPYLDGAADGSAISTGTGTQSPIGIGAAIRRTSDYTGDGYCDGYVLRAVVWLRVPSDEEISDLHDLWMAL